jgi:hypothetical protein
VIRLLLAAASKARIVRTISIGSPVLQSDPRRAEGLEEPPPSVYNRSDRGSFWWRSAVIALLGKKLENDAAHAPGDNGDGGVGSFAALALAGIEGAEITRAAHGHPGALDQRPAQPSIAAPKQSAVVSAAAAGVSGWHQTRISAQMLRIAEPSDVIDFAGNDWGENRSKPGNAQQSADGRVAEVLGADAFFLFLDLRVEQIKQRHILTQHASIRLRQFEPPQEPHASNPKEIAALR